MNRNLSDSVSDTIRPDIPWVKTETSASMKRTMTEAVISYPVRGVILAFSTSASLASAVAFFAFHVLVRLDYSVSDLYKQRLLVHTDT